MVATVIRFFDRPSWMIFWYTDRMAAELYGFDRAPWLYLYNEDKGDKIKQALMEHNSYVRKAAPPERLLESYRQNGWKPLC